MHMAKHMSHLEAASESLWMGGKPLPASHHLRKVSGHPQHTGKNARIGVKFPQPAAVSMLS